MNKRRHLSALDMLFTMKSILKAFIPMFIIFFGKIEDVFKNHTIISICVVVLVLLLLLTVSYLSWKNFVYWFEKDRLVIRSGVFQKDEKTIYYQRIHSVNIQQPLFKRIFNVAQLQIETPGGKKGKSEGELRVLPLPVAIQLQQQLQYFSSITKEKGSISEDFFHTENRDISANGQIQDEENTIVTVKKASSFQEEQPQHQDEASFNDQEADSQHKRVLQGNIVDAPSQGRSSHSYASEIDRGYDAKTKLAIGELLKASLTSFNFGIAIAFIIGSLSFMDDFIRLFNPSFHMDQVLNKTGTVAAITIATLVIALVIALFVWLLSIVLYIFKFANYEISRNKEQIMISYGLLDRKSYIFDQKKVQAVIVEENILRQWLGFAELRIQVVTTDSNQEQLTIHPFIRTKDIGTFITQYLPHRRVTDHVELQSAPVRSYRFFVLVPLIITLLICGAAYYVWGSLGLWALVFIPIISLWSLLQLKDAGIFLDNQDLILRNRWLSRRTYYVKNSQIVMMQTRRSPGQRKKRLRSIGVRVLGSQSSYRVRALEEDIVLKVWKWYSKETKVT